MYMVFNLVKKIQFLLHTLHTLLVFFSYFNIVVQVRQKKKSRKVVFMTGMQQGQIHSFFGENVLQYSIGVTLQSTVLRFADFIWNPKPCNSRPCCSFQSGLTLFFQFLDIWWWALDIIDDLESFFSMVVFPFGEIRQSWGTTAIYCRRK